MKRHYVELRRRDISYIQEKEERLTGLVTYWRRNWLIKYARVDRGKDRSEGKTRK
jgi:hypothetical protein